MKLNFGQAEVDGHQVRCAQDTNAGVAEGLKRHKARYARRVPKLHERRF